MTGAETGMSVFLWIVFSVPPLLLVLLGVMLLRGRGFSLLAGWSEMPREKRDRLNKRAMGRFLGGLMFALAFCALLWPIGISTQMWIFWAGLFLFFAVLAGGVAYLNKSARFTKP